MARALGFLLLWTAAQAAADERFYSIVGPDGRVQLIRSDAGGAGGKAGQGTTSRTQPGTAAAGETTGPLGVPEATSAVPPMTAPTPDADPAFAPYDSDAYVESETIEAALQHRAAGKRRFYVINDGLGERLSEGASAPEDTASAGAAPLGRSEKRAVDRSTALPSTLTQYEGLDEQHHPQLVPCQPLTRLAGASVVDSQQAAILVLSKSTYGFLEPDGLIQAYRIQGQGLRSIRLTAYARNDRKLLFPSPDLAFLDRQGCITRTISGYFERLYPPTDLRHAMLLAELTLHAEEAYVLVLAPGPQDEGKAGATYGYSPYGQLKFILNP